MATGRVAYANARVRALKSQLFDAHVLRRLHATRGGLPLGAADIEASADRESSVEWSDLPGRRFRHLLMCYRVVLRSYPSGQALFAALLRLHEIENVKLAWRAHVRSHAWERWGSFWRSLGSLETVTREDCRHQASLASLVDSLKATPYGNIADITFRAHAKDLVATEFALDRWATASVHSAATSLRRAEATARDLAFAVVRERDLSLLRRGERAYGLAPDAVLSRLVLLPRELSADELTRLATWTPRDGRIVQSWPRAWKCGPDLPADWDALVTAVRRARRLACRRAFLGSAYCLAPAMALLLLQEEEVRGLVSVEESAGRSDAAAALEHALAASAMGA